MKFFVFSCHLIDVQGFFPWVEIFDVPWSRAPILRHSVGTCHRRFTMARWPRVPLKTHLASLIYSIIWSTYRGQFQRPIGLGPGLVFDNLTLECRETFTSAVTCPYHAWKHGKVLISTKKLMKKRGISWNFADLAVRSQRGKSASRSVLTAKRPDLSAQSPTRAQKKPHTAL